MADGRLNVTHGSCDVRHTSVSKVMLRRSGAISGHDEPHPMGCCPTHPHPDPGTLGGHPSPSHPVPNERLACGSTQLCLWSGNGYTGAFWSTTSSTATNTGITIAKSVWNRSSKAARVYSGLNGTGTSTCVLPGSKSSISALASRSARLLTTSTC